MIAYERVYGMQNKTLGKAPRSLRSLRLITT